MIPVMAACAWVILANVAGMVPSNDHYWSRAYALMALGVPIAIWLFLTHGWLLTAVFLIMAASILRWPVIYLLRWLRRLFGK